MYATCNKCGSFYEPVKTTQGMCERCLAGPLPEPVAAEPERAQEKRPLTDIQFKKLDFQSLAKAFCEDAALRGVNVVIGIEEEGTSSHFRVGSDFYCQRLAAQLLAIERASVEDMAGA